MRGFGSVSGLSRDLKVTREVGPSTATLAPDHGLGSGARRL